MKKYEYISVLKIFADYRYLLRNISEQSSEKYPSSNT